MLWGLGRSPSVDIPAITYRKDKNQQLPILNLVEDPEVSVAYAINIALTLELLRPSGTRVKRESVDLAGKSQENCGLELSERARCGCRYLNPIRARRRAADITLPGESIRSARSAAKAEFTLELDPRD